jgi:predicted hydrocarbon binding protein
MPHTRKDFFRKACVAGACMCGFGAIAFSANSNPEPALQSENNDKNQLLVQKYLGVLLLNIQLQLDEGETRKLVRDLAEIHYQDMNMDKIMEPFKDNLDDFLSFLENEWKWKITYNRDSRTILADENKDYCVCPMINLKSGIKPAAICYCSEGFAERMFAKAAGTPVSARIVSSIHRGDERCVYEIKID